ncbi:hypothetical protein [Sphingomonas abietis]|uniref:Uncharacterized protein n=1 Tax=Sphingomonas abietis TaxID=3012344 RepID=A0ABY7NRG0_9SPHN|nr:hypothetical protein [Sphingomonas abietis]WBO23973.1 hypothetical protein PBT88_07640 [Sphingomonas abietis]
MLYIGAGCAVLVLAFIALHHHDTWGFFSYAGLAMLLTFAPALFDAPHLDVPEPSPLDPWRPFFPSLGDPLPLPVATSHDGAVEAGTVETLSERSL